MMGKKRVIIMAIFLIVLIAIMVYYDATQVSVRLSDGTTKKVSKDSFADDDICIGKNGASGTFYSDYCTKIVQNGKTRDDILIGDYKTKSLNNANQHIDQATATGSWDCSYAMISDGLCSKSLPTDGFDKVKTVLSTPSTYWVTLGAGVVAAFIFPPLGGALIAASVGGLGITYFILR